jgi:hypothetical protein
LGNCERTTQNKPNSEKGGEGRNTERRETGVRLGSRDKDRGEWEHTGVV